MVVGGHADGVDDPQVQLARDDRGGDQAAAGDRHDSVPRPAVHQPPRQGLGIPVKLVPRHRKALLIALHDTASPLPPTPPPASWKAFHIPAARVAARCEPAFPPEGQPPTISPPLGCRTWPVM